MTCEVVDLIMKNERSSWHGYTNNVVRYVLPRHDYEHEEQASQLHPVIFIFMLNSAHKSSCILALKGPGRFDSEPDQKEANRHVELLDQSESRNQNIRDFDP
jgi:hypothetical protein